MSRLGEGWAVYGLDLPEAFVFPLTKLDVTQDVHGGGAFVNDSPTRLDCHVHVETGSRHLEILPSLSPLTGQSWMSPGRLSNSSHLPFGCIAACFVGLCLGLVVARHIPDVLEDDDIRWIFVGGRRDDANWLDAHWPVMAATDLYERPHGGRCRY